MRYWVTRRSLAWATLALIMTIALGGCSLPFLGGGAPEPTPPPATRAVVPTFTPTPAGQAPATPTPAPTPTIQVLAVAEAPAASAAVTTTQPLTETGAVTTTGTMTDTAAAPAAPTAAPTATPEPALEVESDQVNVRSGPGTGFGIVGTVNTGERFIIKGRNEDKSWWLICCVNGKEGWIFGELTDEENEEFAPLVESQAAPAQPVVEAPAAPAAPAPAPPAAEPTATPQPAPPPAADPCAGIGGDGCKFKLRGGPSFGNNGGGELKLQLHFIHSGIDGGQPQGSYFVWLEKDGQKLPVADSVRSIALQDQGGTLGKYNYEYKIGLDQIPGNNVAGAYAIWVLDGNGERDSQTFTFSVPDGQGEVWMQFDQG